MTVLAPASWWRGLGGLTRSGSAVEALAWALYDFANTIFSFAIVSFAMSLWAIRYLGEADGTTHPQGQPLSEIVNILSERAGLQASQIDVAQLTDMVDGYALARQGMAGRAMGIATSGSVLADDNYLRESIMNPGAKIVAERLRAAVEALAIPHAGSTCAKIVTVTAGFAACHPRSADDASERLIGIADTALLRAKSEGRNRIGGDGPSVRPQRVSAQRWQRYAPVYAEQAAAHRHFGADAGGRVSPAGDRVQPAPVFVARLTYSMGMRCSVPVFLLPAFRRKGRVCCSTD